MLQCCSRAPNDDPTLIEPYRYRADGAWLAVAFSNTTSFTKSGGVVGGGAEVHLCSKWTAKVEYLYMDLGSISDTLVVTGFGASATLTTNSKIHDNIIRAGLNYKID
jgi:outer membrane immunogenic protein